MTSSCHHHTFVIERDIDAPPALVYTAWADGNAKAAWFVGPSDWKPLIRDFDFREGGSERVRGQFPDGKISDFQCQYRDIVPNERIAYTYDMFVNDKRISVSLATIELFPKGAGTHLKLTEQIVHFDGYPTPEDREQGTKYLVEKASAWIETQTARA